MTTQRQEKKSAASFAHAHIAAGFNNTIVNITDPTGRTICWGTAGTAGFKGTRKATPYAAATAAAQVAQKSVSQGVREVAVFVKGPGSGRDAAIKSLKNSGLNIRTITDITPIPHNGVRSRKRRRV